MKTPDPKRNAIALDVYYDGMCPLCSREIDHYRKHHFAYKINFVDISAPQFSADAIGLDKDEIFKTFHVRDQEGLFHKGVSGFTAIWKVLGIFRMGVLLAESKLTRPLMDAGYLIFSKIRPFLPKKDCPSGSCHIS